MRMRSPVATLLACAVAVAVCMAADAHTGTWKLNETKSKFASGAAKNHTVVYAPAAGESVKITVDGIDASGKPLHNEWTGKFDGRDYPVIGDARSDMRAYKRVDDRTLELTGKKDGKVTQSGSIVVSPDGKTRTVTMTATGATGEKITSTAVYDKS